MLVFRFGRLLVGGVVEPLTESLAAIAIELVDCTSVEELGVF